MSEPSLQPDPDSAEIDTLSPGLELPDRTSGERQRRYIHIDPAPSLDSRVKRLLDVLLATAMLITTLPLCLLIAAAIKLEDGGRVFYRQLRWGKNGRKFETFKFRSMGRRASQNPVVRPAAVADPRVTKVGRILRACGVDELPQILNIIRGDMSFVGPRPLAAGEVLDEPGSGRRTVEDIPGFDARLLARPGLTSPATIYLPKDCDPTTKFRYDLEYVCEHTIWLDFRLIIVSFWISLRGKWESREGKL